MKQPSYQPQKIEVCCGGSCTNKNSDELFSSLQKDFDNTPTEVHMCSCLGRCRMGPNILVDEKKVLHYTKSRNVKQRIQNGEGEPHQHYDEHTLDLTEDFLGDLS